MTITSDLRFGNLYIYFNETLHLALKLPEVLAIQSWEEHQKYTIKILFNTTSMHIQYDTDVKWKKVLEILNKHFYK